MPSSKTTIAEKLLAFAVAAVYAAFVAYIIVGVSRRAAVEVRALQVERARKKASSPRLAAVMPRVATAVRRLLK